MIYGCRRLGLGYNGGTGTRPSHVFLLILISKPRQQRIKILQQWLDTHLLPSRDHLHHLLPRFGWTQTQRPSGNRLMQVLSQQCMKAVHLVSKGVCYYNAQRDIKSQVTNSQYWNVTIYLNPKPTLSTKSPLRKKHDNCPFIEFD